jgi:hypothetical protein
MQTTCKAVERLTRVSNLLRAAKMRIQGSFTAWDSSEWDAAEHAMEDLSWLRAKTIDRNNHSWVSRKRHLHSFARGLPVVSGVWDIIDKRIAENPCRHIVALTSSEFPEIPGQLDPGLFALDGPKRGAGQAVLVPPHDWLKNPTGKQSAAVVNNGTEEHCCGLTTDHGQL